MKLVDEFVDRGVGPLPRACPATSGTMPAGQEAGVLFLSLDAREDLEADPSWLHRTNELVRATVQHMLNQLLSEREGVF